MKHLKTYSLYETIQHDKLKTGYIYDYHDVFTGHDTKLIFLGYNKNSTSNPCCYAQISSKEDAKQFNNGELFISDDSIWTSDDVPENDSNLHCVEYFKENVDLVSQFIDSLNNFIKDYRTTWSHVDISIFQHFLDYFINDEDIKILIDSKEIGLL